LVCHEVVSIADEAAQFVTHPIQAHLDRLSA
jgi:hypothetical protein